MLVEGSKREYLIGFLVGEMSHPEIDGDLPTKYGWPEAGSISSIHPEGKGRVLLVVVSGGGGRY